jgi:TDG/mug DNA glycosylase family protein
VNTPDVLPDQLRRGLKVVFCGTAAGTASALQGAYYAGPGNVFWRTLHEIGLTPRQFAPREFHLLSENDAGLTDVAKKVFGPDSRHLKGDFDTKAFTERILSVSPAAVAFNGKNAVAAYLGRPTRRISYGLQEERLGGSILFVLPSTSGAARRFWDVEYWVELARLVQQKLPLKCGDSLLR